MIYEITDTDKSSAQLQRLKKLLEDRLLVLRKKNDELLALDETFRTRGAIGEVKALLLAIEKKAIKY